MQEPNYLSKSSLPHACCLSCIVLFSWPELACQVPQLFNYHAKLLLYSISSRAGRFIIFLASRLRFVPVNARTCTAHASLRLEQRGVVRPLKWFNRLVVVRRSSARCELLHVSPLRSDGMRGFMACGRHVSSVFLLHESRGGHSIGRRVAPIGIEVHAFSRTLS